VLACSKSLVSDFALAPVNPWFTVCRVRHSPSFSYDSTAWDALSFLEDSNSARATEFPSRRFSAPLFVDESHPK
jgi:hypothetical protein